MIKANPERVLRDLHMLREIGRYETGVHRPTLSDDDIKTRHWLKDELVAIGHDTHIDGIANVIGYSPAPGRKMLCGSHLESQNRAGWLDGALGVVYALEAARAVVESGEKDAGVDVMAFADEEGHFGSMIGSNSLVGNMTEAMMDASKNRTTGEPLRDALDRAGFTGPRTSLDPSRYIGMLEAHIEQGDSLEADELKIGVVTSIVGIWQFQLTFKGLQNHAGTTRMAIRKDAGVSMMRVYQRLQERFPQEVAERTVWTVGSMTLDPGAPSIVPGGAEMQFQFRDADPDLLAKLEGVLTEVVTEENANGPCPVTLTAQTRGVPARMDSGLQNAIEAAAEAIAPGKHVRMPSGAGHDAQVIAQKMPSSMLFIPSINGVSHHWTEDTSDADIALGAQVYVDAVARMLAE
jgi:beta-ureidopropionase / N-carbamoyl-L-amino-acid hydrolase